MEDFTVRLLSLLEENHSAQEDEEALRGMELGGFAQWAALDETLADIATALRRHEQ